MNEDEKNIQEEIESVFNDAWKEAPTIGGLSDLGEHIARSILEISDKTETADQNIFLGEIIFLEQDTEDGTRGKGTLGIHLMTASKCPVNDLLKNYTPNIKDEEFIAVMSDNGEAQLTFIAFGNGTNITTLLDRNDDEIGITGLEQTRQMLKNSNESLISNKLSEILDRVIEIASK